MRWMVIVTAMAIVGPAAAQAVTDGSDDLVPKHRLSEAFKRMGAQVNDPKSLQVRSLRYVKEQDRLCGMYNAKNAVGAYDDFKPFADVKGEAILAPAQDDRRRQDVMREIVKRCVD